MTAQPDKLHARRMRVKQALLLPAVLIIAACVAPPPAPPAKVIPQPVPLAPVAPVVPPAPVAPPRNTPEQDALRALSDLQDRIYRVAAPLLVNNTQICKGSARSLLGFTAKNKYSYTDEFADAAQKTLGLDERLQVSGVLAGSGAARVGVRRGDRLISVDDKPMPQGPKAERQAGQILGPLVSGRTSVTLAVERNGAEAAMNVPLTLACAFGIEIGNVDQVNAYSDGMRVLVTRGMMNFAATDEELAYVLAREMAHNVLKHAQRLRMTATAAGMIDNMIRMRPDLSTLVGTGGLKVVAPEMDAAADKLALYLLVRAGYGIERAVPFWQRLATQFPANVLNGYTALHPATSTRVLVMEKTAQEIRNKQAERKPLLP